MPSPSQKYLNTLEKVLYNGISIDSANMDVAQKMRTKIVYEAYTRWLQDKQIDARDLIRRISQREYQMALLRAREGDEMAQEYCRACNITDGKLRSPFEISNDVAAFNHIVSYLSVDQSALYKMKALDGADFLVREGKKMGNMNAVNQGVTHMRELFNNFDDKQTAADQLPDTNIRITLDVGVIKPDRVNYTEEEKRAYGKKYGITQREYAEFQEVNDDWAIEDDQADSEPILDPIAQESML